MTWTSSASEALSSKSSSASMVALVGRDIGVFPATTWPPLPFGHRANIALYLCVSRIKVLAVR